MLVDCLLISHRTMSACYLCYRSLASIRCLICREYFCLTCSGSHRHNHLLDALEDRLNSRIHNLPVQFDENFHEQYSQANEHLQSWMTEIRRQFERSLQYELEQFLKSQFELLKRRTDEYVEEYVQYFTNLRANVRYAKQRQMDCNYDQEIIRLVGIEKALLEQFHQHQLRFRLDTHSIDFTKYINVERQFHESPIPQSLEFTYRFHQPIQTLSLRSTIQHIASSCLDLFVFVLEPSPRYPRLLEFSTSSIASKIALEYSIDFPAETHIIDMCWSINFNQLFLLTSFCLHQYDKFNRKIHAKLIEVSDPTEKWYRVTSNRFGIYILTESNSIEFYNRTLSQNTAFHMKDYMENIRLVYDLQGQADCLCTLTYTNDSSWRIDLFANRQLELKRTLQLSESLRPPLKLTHGNRRGRWMIIDSENHRLIVFDDRMKNIEHFPVNLTPNGVAMLEDQTLVLVSPDIPGSRLTFYSPDSVQ